MTAVFKLELADNPDGWGPDLSQEPEIYKGIPYAPFSKGDKLGRVADWNQSSQNATYNKWKQRRERDWESGVTTAFNAFATEEDNDGEFELVDNRPTITRFGPPRWRNQWRNNRIRGRNNRNQQDRSTRSWQSKGKTQQTRWQKQNARNNKGRQRGRGWWNRQDKTLRQPSVEVRANWEVVAEIDFGQLNKMKLEDGNVPVGEDIVRCGELEYFDRKYDTITTKNEKPLERFETRAFFKATTTDDPILEQLAMENHGNAFGTDAILSALMVEARSIYSWDVVIQRAGNQVFFDKRDGSEMDFLTVNETANEPPSIESDNVDTINGPNKLAQEASFINQNYTQQVLIQNNEKHTFEQPNPFVTDETDVASVAYRYRKFVLDEDITVVCRTELDGALKHSDGVKLLSVKALNEYDPRLSNIDWRQKLDTQRGAVLAMELKNNSNKLGRWTAQALMADADLIKIGYVSRTDPNDNYKHAILGSQTYSPQEMARQINLNPSNMWAVLRAIIERCLELPEGKYVFVKDPNKPCARIYAVPPDTFEEDSSSDDVPSEE